MDSDNKSKPVRTSQDVYDFLVQKSKVDLRGIGITTDILIRSTDEFKQHIKHNKKENK